jgi:hypothetical protein
LRALSLCTCCRHYPGTATGGTASLIRPVISAFPERVIGSACASSFSRLTQRSLALRPTHSRCHLIVARLPEGFRHFVTPMPAPVASGWSGCRVRFAPTGKRRLFTAHTQCGKMARRSAVLQADIPGAVPSTFWMRICAPSTLAELVVGDVQVTGTRPARGIVKRSDLALAPSLERRRCRRVVAVAVDHATDVGAHRIACREATVQRRITRPRCARP